MRAAPEGDAADVISVVAPVMTATAAEPVADEVRQGLEAVDLVGEHADTVPRPLPGRARETPWSG
jgi:hypothetical protein